MGNWNRRYQPRKKFRHQEYEDPPLSPPRPYNNLSYSSGVADNRLPSWEIDYCNSVRVPWKKVLASKKYICCYPSVLNWDGSAGEEALKNAKQRFWAMINGLPCDNPLPDPDLFIDEIDWNPHMDPELMAELDLPVFDPDKAQKVEKLETINEGVECALTQDDKNQYSSDDLWERNNTQGAGSLKDTNDNPWERNNTQGAGSLKDTCGNPWERNTMQCAGSLKDPQGWGRWEDTVNLQNGNPWEQSCIQQVDSLKDNAWKTGNESWVWSQGIDKSRSSPCIVYGRGNSWNFNGQNMPVRQEGQGRGQRWGQGDNNSWGWSPGNTNAEGPRNLVNCGYSFENNYSTNSNERAWRDNWNESWGGRNAEYQGNEPKYWDSQTGKRGGRSFRGGCRKRESSIQHTSKYKSSKYHGDTYGDSRQL